MGEREREHEKVAIEVPVWHLAMSGRKLAFLGQSVNYYQSRLSEPHPAPPSPKEEREEATLLLLSR